MMEKGHKVCHYDPCSRVYQPTGHWQLFCSPACRTAERKLRRSRTSGERHLEDLGKDRPVGPPRKWQPLDPQGHCTRCTPAGAVLFGFLGAQERWLFQEVSGPDGCEQPVSVERLCGPCVQREVTGHLVTDPRLVDPEARLYGHPEMCAKGHMGEWVQRQSGGRYCKGCNRERDERLRQARREEARRAEGGMEAAA